MQFKVVFFCESRKPVRLPENQEVRVELERNTSIIIQCYKTCRAGRLNYCITTLKWV